MLKRFSYLAQYTKCINQFISVVHVLNIPLEIANLIKKNVFNFRLSIYHTNVKNKLKTGGKEVQGNNCDFKSKTILKYMHVSQLITFHKVHVDYLYNQIN